MKKLFMVLMIAASAFPLAAQKGHGGGAQTVDATQVPDSVKNAQAKNYAGIVVTKWELTNGKKGNHFIAEFVDKDNLRSKCRYDAAGRTILTTKFYGPTQVPPAVATAAKRYAGYSVTRVEEMISVKKNKTWFSVRLKSPSAKLTVLLDENGNEITPDKAPEEVQPEAVPPTNN